MTLFLTALEDRLAPADLRVMTYNITASTGTLRSGLVAANSTTTTYGILDTIGKQNVGGLARPVDVLILQETDTGFAAVNAVASALNTYYGAGTYSAVQVAGGTTGGGTQGLVFRNSTVDHIATTKIGTTSSTGIARQPLRHQLRLENTTTDIYIYNSHMKSDTATEDVNRRTIEAQAIRDNADLLPTTANIIYAGDFNIYAPTEGAYTELRSSGNGQANDFLNPAGNWARNSNTWDGLYTQAPSNTPPAGLTGGGLDDRFDFLLTSTDLDNEFRAGSYRTFGNNGSLTANSSINVSSNTALGNTPLTTAQQQDVLTLLTTFSDHLPVVADFNFVTGPTAVSSYAVNGGAQRSRVSTITVAFNAAVPTALTAANFSVSGFSGTIGVTHTAGSSTATVSFSGTGTTGGSLNDGLYTLTVNLAGVTNNTFAFHRLFGDINGDRTVDGGSDFVAFGFRTAANDPMDFNGDGTVDGPTDFAQFGLRFGKTI